MRGLLSRELDAIAGTGAFVVALAGHATLLSAFVFAWGDGSGLPIFPDRTFYQQLRLVQAAALCVLLPWTAARCAAAERGNELVMLAALTALKPSRVIAARALALIVGLGLVTLGGAPVALIGLRMSAGDASRFVRDEAALLALAAITCGIVIAWRHLIRDRVLGWVAATVSTIGAAVIVRVLFPSVAVAATLLATAGTALIIVLLLRADTSFRYLSEDVA